MLPVQYKHLAATVVMVMATVVAEMVKEMAATMVATMVAKPLHRNHM